MSVRILVGDCRERLRELPSESVNCVVTSPPYFGLRDYGVGGQIGLEASPDEFVAELVAVFREVRRVLKDDGTLWLNLGDSYATSGGANTTPHLGAIFADRTRGQAVISRGKRLPRGEGRWGGGNAKAAGLLKPKDLIGIPWRVAFALQADGWVLRQDICWSKPNPMPESVTDRCTKSHEYIFLFAKAAWSGPEPGRYAHISADDARWLALFFDAEGNLCLRREKSKGTDYGAHSAQIVLANSNRPLLEAAAAIVGDGSILERPGTNAPMFYWQMAGKKAADLLAVIYPHLIVKQRQARCLLHLESLKAVRGGHERLSTDAIEYRDRLWNAVKELNHFGSPDISWVPEPKFGRWAGCERYYYDAAAIAEPLAYGSAERLSQDLDKQKGSDRVPGKTNGTMKAVYKERYTGQSTKDYAAGKAQDASATKQRIVDRILAGELITRNKRSVWTVTTQPFTEAHFATFPPDLIEPCIKAGCPAGGTVLDPFGGAGTTGLVADRLGRDAILIELNPTYAEMAGRRLSGDAPMFASVQIEPPLVGSAA